MPLATPISSDEVKPVLLGTGQSYLRTLMRGRGLTVTALAAELARKAERLTKSSLFMDTLPCAPPPQRP